VDGLGCVRVRTNLYSVPVPVGKTVEVRLYPGRVEVHDEGRYIARHERSYERNQQVLDLRSGFWWKWAGRARKSPTLGCQDLRGPRIARFPGQSQRS
jgi:hypothetical protein